MSQLLYIIIVVTMFKSINSSCSHDDGEYMPLNPRNLSCTEINAEDLKNRTRTKYAEHYYKMIVTNSSLREIDSSMLFGFKRMECIDLSSNQVEKIKDKAFNKMNKLTTLLLNDNQIKNLSHDNFRDLEKLCRLDLSNNDIEVLSPDLFLSLKHLNILNLSGNRISRLRSNSFLSLVELTILDISFNQIAALEENVFFNLLNLTKLNASNNKIVRIHSTVFQDTKKLKFINLHNNTIEELVSDSFHESKALEFLILSHNNITKLPTNLFINNGLLRVLDVKNNSIQILEDNALAGLMNLEKIDLRHNEVTAISSNIFINCVSLREIFLANNKIKIVALGSFQKQNSLKQLDLSNNEIANIEYGTFTGLNESGIRLNISYNALKLDDDNILIFTGFKNLKSLSLLGNSIKGQNICILVERFRNLTVEIGDYKLPCDWLNDLRVFKQIKITKKKCVNQLEEEEEEEETTEGSSTNMIVSSSSSSLEYILVNFTIEPAPNITEEEANEPIESSFVDFKTIGISCGITLIVIAVLIAVVGLTVMVWKQCDPGPPHESFYQRLKKAHPKTHTNTSESELLPPSPTKPSPTIEVHIYEEIN